MRLLTALVVANTLLFAAACSPLSQATMETLGSALFPPQGAELSVEQVRALPFAVLKLESPKYGSAYFALGRVVDGQRFWAAASGQVLVESDGLIKRTTGFPSTLAGTQFIGQDPFAKGLQHLEGGESAQRRVDWLPGYRYGILLNSRFTRPKDTIVILQNERKLARFIEEELHSTDGEFRATNRYWYSPIDGTMIRSEQQLTPDERVTITFTQSPEKQS